MADTPPLSPVHSKLDVNADLDSDEESETDAEVPEKLNFCHYLIILFWVLVAAFATTTMVYSFAT